MSSLLALPLSAAWSLAHSLAVLAAEAEEEVDPAISYGVGAGVLVLLVLAIGALLAFGGGREHT